MRNNLETKSSLDSNEAKPNQTRATSNPFVSISTQLHGLSFRVLNAINKQSTQYLQIIYDSK